MKNISIILLLLFSSWTAGFQPVDINQATKDQIALLPGVGKKLAENFVSFRKKEGRFSHVDQLLLVSGMTEKKLASMKDLVVVKSTLLVARKPPPNEPKTIVIAKKPLMPLEQLNELVLRNNDLVITSDISLQSRVRNAAWLPKLSALFDIDHADVMTEKKSLTITESITSRGGRDFALGFKAVFDLDKLIYNSDELEVQKLSLRRSEKREEILLKVHKHYFHYLRLLESTNTPLLVADAQLLSLQLKEIEAMLDIFSGGAFSRFQKSDSLSEQHS